jgi:YihY family inner membrane protein
VSRATERLDDLQRRHRALAFAVGVSRKFVDDEAWYRAALIAYYGFLSIFPLLMVAVTIVDVVVRNDPELRRRIVTEILGYVPVVGDSVQVEPLPGSGATIVIGLLVTLWAGLGVLRVIQVVSNDVWGVPTRQRLGFLASRIRGLLLLAFFGAFFVGVTLISGVVTSVGGQGLDRLWLLLVNVLLNTLLFLASYRFLTDRHPTWSEVWPGAVFAGILWTGLQAAGTYLVTRKTASASAVYGVFATAIGLMLWLQIGAMFSIVGVEINAVRVGRLWPRSLGEERRAPRLRLELAAGGQTNGPPQQRGDGGGGQGDGGEVVGEGDAGQETVQGSDQRAGEPAPQVLHQPEDR